MAVAAVLVVLKVPRSEVPLFTITCRLGWLWVRGPNVAVYLGLLDVPPVALTPAWAQYWVEHVCSVELEPNAV